MGLVTAKEIAKAINLSKYGVLGTFVGWVLMKVTRISAINRFYDSIAHLEGESYANAILEHFDIDYEIPEEDFKRLPKEGPYVTISNHPLGAIDGILLFKLMLRQRPDYKIMANFLLERMVPLKPYILPVNPFNDHKDARSNLAGFKKTLEHLKNGHVLGVFPAGEVSTYRDGKLIVDKPWEEAVIKLIRKANVPVVPIYFHAKNSSLFYRISKLGDSLRTAMIPSQVFSQSNRPIKVRIGQPISLATQQEQQSIEEYTDLLRRKTYMLSNAYEKERLIDQIPTSLKLPKQPKKIADAVRKEVMEGEIEKL
ncbi:MAG: lysophospholipid acyltransferase family protein, partial [Maribacter dokdonensis]